MSTSAGWATRHPDGGDRVGRALHPERRAALAVADHPDRGAVAARRHRAASPHVGVGELGGAAQRVDDDRHLGRQLRAVGDVLPVAAATALAPVGARRLHPIG